MYYLQIDLLHRPQLEKIQPKKLEVFVDELWERINQFGLLVDDIQKEKAFDQSSSMILSLKIPEQAVFRQRIYQFFMSFLSFYDNFLKDFPGYRVFLCAGNISPEEFVFQSQQTPGFNKIWFHDSIVQEFIGLVETGTDENDQDSNQRNKVNISSFRREGNSFIPVRMLEDTDSSAIIDNVFLQKDYLESTEKLLQDCLQAPDIPIISVSDSVHFSLHLEEALRIQEIETVHIYAPTKSTAPFAPFSQAIPDNLEGRIDELLTSNEMGVWKSMYPLYSNTEIHLHSVDYLLIWDLFLRYLDRSAREKSQVSLVIVHSLENLNKEDMLLLRSLIDQTGEFSHLKWIFTSKESNVPELLLEYCKLIPAPDWNSKSQTSLTFLYDNYDEKTAAYLEKLLEESPTAFFHGLLIAETNSNQIPETRESSYDSSTGLALSLLPKERKIFLYLTYLIEDLLPFSDYLPIFKRLGIHQDTALEIREEMIQIGFLESSGTCPNPRGKTILQKDKNIELLKIHTEVTRVLSAIAGTQNVSKMLKAATIYLRMGKEQEALNLFLKTVQILQYYGEFEEAELHLQAIQKLFPSSKKSCTLLLQKNALLKGEKVQTGPLISLNIQNLSLEKTHIELLKQLKEGELEKAIRTGRDAVMEEANPESLLFLAIAYLRSKKIKDAADYAALAYETAKEQGFPAMIIRTGFYLGLALFLYGNLSASIRIVNEALLCASANGRRKQEIQLYFLLSRIHFELGDYEQSIDQLSKALSHCTLYRQFKPRTVLNTWLNRILAFRGEYDSAISSLLEMDDTIEKYYFLAESYYLKGEYLEAHRVLDRLILKNDQVSPVYSPLWNSGFQDMEEICFAVSNDQSFVSLLVLDLHSLIQYETEKNFPSYENFEFLTRHADLGEDFPYFSMFFLHYSMIAPEDSDNERVNKTALLSKALKALQSRSARIDDTQVRRRFREQSYWHKILLAEAVSRKLI
jgi:tetratricopeptide (TPR) repeat protein